MSKRPHVQHPLESFVERLTRAIGSPISLVVHTLFFAGCFVLVLLGVDLEKVLLILTTVVSLEAIYLSLFIQMAVNRASDSLEAVEEDIDEIAEDVAGIEKDIDEIQEDIDEIEKDVDEIAEDIDEIEKDIDEIEKDEEEHERRDVEDAAAMKVIESRLAAILEDLEKLRKQ